MNRMVRKASDAVVPVACALVLAVVIMMFAGGCGESVEEQEYRAVGAVTIPTEEAYDDEQRRAAPVAPAERPAAARVPAGAPGGPAVPGRSFEEDPEGARGCDPSDPRVRIEEMDRRITELKDKIERLPPEGTEAAAESEQGAAGEERRGGTGQRIVASDVEWLDRRADQIRSELETLRAKLDRLEREVGEVAGRVDPR